MEDDFLMASVWEEYYLLADQLDQLDQLPCMCAWGDCGATFEGDMPHGWHWVLAYWAPQPFSSSLLEVPQEDMLRDCVLCPKHAAALERQLKELPRHLDGPAAGRA
jgi:hypothetical protein